MLGIITLVIGLLVIVDIVIEWRSLDGLTVGAVVVALGALVWLAMIRPSVVAYEEVLVIRNILRDTWIPWRLVTRTELSPVLVVHTDDRAYRSVAVGITAADRRAMYRNRRDATRQRAALDAEAGRPQAMPGGTPQARRSPAEHIAHRIEVMAGKYADNAPERTAVERTWALPELGVFAVAVAVAVVTSLLA